MSALAIMILIGAKDNVLCEIVSDLERMRDKSAGEQETLAVALARLDQLTKPTKES